MRSHARGFGVRSHARGFGVRSHARGFGVRNLARGFGVRNHAWGALKKRAQINSVSDLPLFIWLYVPNFLPKESPTRFWPTNIGGNKMRAV